MLSSVLAVVVGLGETLCAKAPVVQRLTAYSGCGMSRQLSRGVPAEPAPITWGLIDAAIGCKYPDGEACGEPRQRQREAGEHGRAHAEHGPGAVVDSQGVAPEMTSSRRRMGLAPVTCATPPSNPS